MEANSFVPPHAEPRAAITAPSKVPAFCSGSSNILSSSGLYEDLIFPCVLCQVSLSVKFWCFLHDRLVSVVQTHTDVSWESARAQLWCNLYWGKWGVVLSQAKTVLLSVFILVLKCNFKIQSKVCFTHNFLIPNSRPKLEVCDLENYLRTAL